MTDQLINIRNLSDQLKIPVKTIRNKLSNGTWPLSPIRIGRAVRWLQSEVDRFINPKSGQSNETASSEKAGVRERRAGPEPS